MYERVLVATDGSESARRAVAHAVSLAAQVGADLHAVAVVETRTAYDNAIVDPEVVRENLRSEAEDALAEVRAAAEERGVPVTVQVTEGVPHERILAAIDDRGADLVVLGATGRSAFKTALLGSATTAVLREASVPVVVVDGETEAD
ncbi:universal stress protein [Halomarina ordinaria]|uniref:Universal stress protein n=1 Tax=Halomarina ordinaria TaxID=3033939 RepID=A0ABD5U8F2_9EURY|nr:universal stress protein [Halomarina sp. PSRA2]